MPFGVEKAALLGAAGVGGFEMTGGARTSAGGYNYETYTASGTVTAVGEGTVDLILVGGGGGAYNTNSYTGGGGAGGVVHATGVPMVAGDYTLTIGAAGAVTGNNPGGYSLLANLSLDGNNFNIIAGGGGYGGQGDGTCQAGGPGSSSMPSDGTYYYRSGGGGGGGGEWNGVCGGAGGFRGNEGSATTGTIGTWTTYNGGNGGTDSGGYGSGAGGGSGNGNHGGGTGSSQEGGAGYVWLDSEVYGRGGNGMNDGTIPPAVGLKGGGAGDQNAPTRTAQDGVLIVRWS